MTGQCCFKGIPSHKCKGNVAVFDVFNKHTGALVYKDWEVCDAALGWVLQDPNLNTYPIHVSPRTLGLPTGPLPPTAGVAPCPAPPAVAKHHQSQGRKILDGILSCSKCHDLAPYAESNQPDGTFLCFACRSKS